MNNFIGALVACFYIAFIIFVIKVVAYFIHKAKLKRLEAFRKETNGISYYLFHQGKESCIIGSQTKLVRSQMETIVPLYQNDSKVISFREGLSADKKEYAYCKDGHIVFSSDRRKQKEEIDEYLAS